jgi:hypothetical protein
MRKLCRGICAYRPLLRTPLAGLSGDRAVRRMASYANFPDAGTEPHNGLMRSWVTGFSRQS